MVNCACLAVDFPLTQTLTLTLTQWIGCTHCVTRRKGLNHQVWGCNRFLVKRKKRKETNLQWKKILDIFGIFGSQKKLETARLRDNTVKMRYFLYNSFSFAQ